VRNPGAVLASLILSSALSPLLAQPTAAAAQPATAPATLDPASGTPVEIPLEVIGKQGVVPRDLAPSDFVVREGSTSRTVLGIGPWKQPWRVVIYVDRVLSGSRTLRGAAGALAALAREVSALGPVEIVVAEPEPRVFLTATRESKGLDNSLSRLWLQSEGRDELRALRRRFLEESEARAEGGEGTTPESSTAAAVATGSGGASAEEAAREAAETEVRLVRGRLDAMVEWLVANRGQGPGLLFWVNDGFDLDAASFYHATPLVPGAGWTLDDLTSRTAQSLAALGWTIYPLPMGEAALPDLSRVRPGGTRVGPVGVTVTLGDKKRQETKPPPIVLRDPLEPLRWLATASGGEVLRDPATLGPVLARLKGRLALRFAAGSTVPGQPVALEVGSGRADLTLRSARWRGADLPAAVTASRAVRLATGEEEGGGIEVLSAAEVEEVTPAGRKLAVEVKVQPRGEGAPGRLVATVAETDGKNLLFRQPLRDGTERGGGEVAYLLHLEAPIDAQRLAVVVEREEGAPWGGSALPLEGGLAGAAAAPSGASGPYVRIKAPPLGEELGGPVRLEMLGQGPGVARVDLLLGGRKLGSCAVLPCGIEVDLGRRPGAQVLHAVAYDEEGGELARDDLPLGDGEALRVRIVEPASRRGVGPVEVEAEVEPPSGQRIERVEFFWEERLAGTVYGAPYRHRIAVPADHPLGTLRVEARLEDGTTAEDSLVLNSPGVAERINVRLVEVNVVVSDEHGKPVRGLPQDAFRLTEDGRQQALASFENTGDLPLTLALTLDSSASMFRKLPVVTKAVDSLLAEGLTPRDRALLIEFADQPRLVQPATRDLVLLHSALQTLQADGGTGLWDAIVYSLAQLRGIAGRKALVVYSDGIDQGGKVSYAECLRAVRASGLPVFLIVSNALAAAGQDGGFFSESIGTRLHRLADGAGGKVVFLKPDQNLDEVYREILGDLRSRYTLSYYPPEAAARHPHVDVELLGRRDLSLRVVSGATARR
jgi:VWFA-related protein